jgi:hypothetical protein
VDAKAVAGFLEAEPVGVGCGRAGHGR